MDILVDLPAYLIIFALGASIGSFLNVIVYRVPAGLSVWYPPSRCPHCHTRLGLSENVPVLGWLWLRGKCRHCHAPISMRYPLVEGLMGLLFLLVYVTIMPGTIVQLFGLWALLAWLVALSLIDIDTLILPNPLTQSGLVVGLCFQGLLGLKTAGVIDQLMVGVLGAVLGLWLFEAIAFLGSMAFGQTAMGAGDAKLAALMGAWLGWKMLLVASFIACGLGAFIGAGAMAVGILDRRQPMPFGPFLAIAAGITALWGEIIVSMYMELFFPVI
ncbi:prepilin peptidase [Arthrospira platensis]|jgi:leader peptidase (prepilin peptidase)/N-methyltransferase|uniref:Prepilin leader peptidase/N-methyltransferase n=1 Tax=Limnospira platensis NIES-46 TaxID=1236695 RepID=A0A5M3T823_LIMPL|nr:A24 family peptidase [Arthrospira platensis]AMW29351.1 methyltransferase [Arthrospira platensis YZ]MBD2671997.1 prepilin peptidase [Arthrospira platensis FACHB-439]MBD2712051.1 prepilin peptidase [Arthrospira platensis FACHB-835]MDF2213283.1 prepilin peptidase [Arthrospira platensis NCB002]MDT9184865.1 prepilin peptidase [Limnospira sp. PMC 289.06]MDT9297892.1 prepilin peptidase [Arthrospira platensis PCC 7345]QQW27224.1 prepilin peptidase [Arthrospira sp. PCC 9108]BAI91638.1 prepilin pe